MVTVRAYAKINLTLNILDKREDGYHEVEMIMQSVSLHDRMTVELNQSGRITLSCSHPMVPLDQSNIAYKAAQRYLTEVDRRELGVHIDIEKRIPVQAGLAGGSADGAAVLVGLNRALGGILALDRLCEIGGRIGADVPFCIMGGAAAASGTGTSLRQISATPDCHIVVAKPELSVSTPRAYRDFDERGTRDESGRNKKAEQALSQGELYSLCENMFNVFEQVITHEDIARIKAVMQSHGCIKAQMSGSGPSVFGVFDDEQLAENAASGLRQRGIAAHVCLPVRYGCEIA